MKRLAVRSLAARKLRAVLSAIAVVLGVAMVSGSYIETDQIRNAFEGITEQSVEGIDVVVSPDEEFTTSFPSELPTIPAGNLARVERVEGVAAAEGQLAATGNLVVEGEPVDTLGAPAIVNADVADEFDPTTVIAGRGVDRAGEAVVLEQNAIDNGIEVGDRIGLVTRRGERALGVVGIVRFGETGSAIGGATFVGIDPQQMERWFDLSGRLTGISVIAEPGLDPDELAARIREVLPAGVQAQTAEQSADEEAEAVNDQIGAFLTPALLALAGAAVLVGAFIIFNTFSITVAQRSREFAMLRALGATRRQVLASVVLEALAIGSVASALGLAAGIGLSKLLNALFDAVGFGIPRTDLVLEPRTIAVSAGVGIGVTMVAALVPALRATRVSPIAAMSASPARPSARARAGAAIGAVALLLLGAAAVIQGLYGSGPASSRLGAIALGAVALFLAIAFIARFLVRPLAALIGWPIQRTFGTPGRLARENSERNPARTATTAAALMIGVGLVVFVAVFAAGLKSSIGRQIDDLVRAELVVYGEGFQPLSQRVEGAVEDVDGVVAAVATPYEQVEVNGERSNVAYDVVIGVDPAELLDVYTFDWIEGDDSLVANLGPGDVLVEEQFAKAHDVDVGDAYEVAAPTGTRAGLRAVGVYRDPTILQGSITSPETLGSFSEARDSISLLIATEDDASAVSVEAGVRRALRAYPNARVDSKAEYKETFEAQLDQIIYLLYALLAMSVVISLFGIANSLYLSIHERTGELGILRAIGATRAQVRRVIRYESVITAVIGGLLGVAVGIAFAWVVIESLAEFGLSISVPVGQLLALLVLTVAVGIAGAIAPSRRAARVDVLEAVRQE